MLKRIEDILTQCIEDVKVGRCSVEDCLAKYPSVSKELEPLLRLALSIREAPDIKPAPAFKVRARVQLIEQIHARQAVTKWPWFRYTGQVKPIPYKRRFNMVAIIVAVVLAISALGGGTAYASQGSLPGDVLYPVKLGTEQVRLILADDATDAELWLEFADSRVGEMSALVEKGRPEKVNIAVNGYGKAIAMATEKIGVASGEGLSTAEVSEEVAEATSRHLSALDEVYDKVPDEAKPAIERAREVSMTGQENALAALARENPVRATEINLAAMEGRLNRARVKAEENNIEAMEAALAQFQALNELGETISEIAQGLGEGTTTVEELVALATDFHLAALGEVLAIVPEEAQEAIESAMAVSVEGYKRAVEALAETGALGGIPEVPPIPESVPDEVKAKLLKPEVPARR